MANSRIAAIPKYAIIPQRIHMNTAKSLHNKNIEGARYLLAKDYQNAANAFSDVLKADPNNAGALAGVAALLYSTCNWREA